MKISKKPATNEKEVQQLESELDIKFTQEYYQFLLRYNGGVPVNNVFMAEEYGESIMDDFYGIYSNDTIGDIKNNCTVFKNRIPKEFVPIGCDALGNQIILGVKEKYAGKIYFWWHEGESDSEEPNYTNIYKISNTFNDFVNSLREYVEEKKGNWEDFFEEGNYHQVKNLIASGWNVNTVLSFGITPLSFMVMRNNFEIVKLLIDNGADLTGVAQNAIDNKLTKMLEVLLLAGADVNERDNEGYTLFLSAISLSDFECVSILLKYNADKNLTNDFGFNPYSLAEKVKSRGEKGIDEIIELLNTDK